MCHGLERAAKHRLILPVANPTAIIINNVYTVQARIIRPSRPTANRGVISRRENLPNGSILVSETILYNFRDQDRRGVVYQPETRQFTQFTRNVLGLNTQMRFEHPINSTSSEEEFLSDPNAVIRDVSSGSDSD